MPTFAKYHRELNSSWNQIVVIVFFSMFAVHGFDVEWYCLSNLLCINILWN